MEHDYKPMLSKEAQKYYDRVKNEIKYCDGDQPWDGGEALWLQGEKMSLSDLFEDYNIPEKHWETISSHMICQGCGSQNFDAYSDIGIDDKFDRKILAKVAEGERKYKHKIDELIDFARQFPSLILSNPLAKRISKEIASRTLPTWEKENYTCFRSRKVTGSKVLLSEDVDAPPEGIANIGRYNHAGKSAFYVSNTQACSAAEILEDLSIDNIVWVQQYEVEKVNKILDLTINWDDFYNLDSILFVSLLNYRVFEQKALNSRSTWKPEYLLTNFLSDCARLAGYNGLRYSSIKGLDYNLVIFDKSKLNVKTIGDPQAVKIPAESQMRIIDF